MVQVNYLDIKNNVFKDISSNIKFVDVCSFVRPSVRSSFRPPFLGHTFKWDTYMERDTHTQWDTQPHLDAHVEKEAHRE